MPTSTNRPKSKPGQAAGKQPTGKQDKDQGANGATQPLAKKNGDSPAAASKPTTGSTQPAAKTSGSTQPTAARSSGSAESAAKTPSGKLESAAKAASEEAQPTAKTPSGKLESATKAASEETQPATKASGSLQPTAKPGTGSAQPAVKVIKATGSVKATPKPEPKVKAPPLRQPTSRKEQKREGRRDEISRRIDERRQQREKEQRNRTLRRWGVIGGGILLALGVVAFIAYQIITGLNLPPYQKGSPIDGISCDQLEQTASHYHAHLAIYVNGKPVSIANNIGRQGPNCFYWLHTHDIAGDDGVIHIEAPANDTFQLYQFFDIWGQQFSGSNLMGHTIDKSHPLTVYVYTPPQSDIDAHNQAVQQAEAQNPNGPLPSFTVTPTSGLKPYTGDPRKIQLKAYELIVLEYGSPLVPPQSFSFNGGE